MCFLDRYRRLSIGRPAQTAILSIAILTDYLPAPVFGTAAARTAPAALSNSASATGGAMAKPCT
jgi:hypothetical protein